MRFCSRSFSERRARKNREAFLPKRDMAQNLGGLPTKCYIYHRKPSKLQAISRRLRSSVLLVRLRSTRRSSTGACRLLRDDRLTVILLKPIDSFFEKNVLLLTIPLKCGIIILFTRLNAEFGTKKETDHGIRIAIIQC